MTDKNICRVCEVGLNETNQSTSNQNRNIHICKKCDVERIRLWRQKNPQKCKQLWTEYNRRNGCLSLSENKDCALFLGVHIAERLLSNVFKNVQVMPFGNPKFDFICSRNKLIDVKSACLSGSNHARWSFHIGCNTVPDYFLCLAFNNRENLIPMHVWMVPGNELNRFTGVSVSPNTVHKWNSYEMDITKVTECCSIMKQETNCEDSSVRQSARL